MDDVGVVEAAHEQAKRNSTPCGETNISQCIVAVIEEVYETLRNSSDLSPRNVQVGSALTKLVSMVLFPSISEEVVKSILGNQQVQKISAQMWRYLSSAEFQMESWWARRFLSEKTTLQNTKAFWYRDNYNELAKLELAHLARIGQRPGPNDHIFFVGSGPLPFSAVEYFMQTGARITVVDNDPLATKLSSALLQQWGLAGNISVTEAAGEKLNYSVATHLIVAALVRRENEVILRALKTGVLATIGVRRDLQWKRLFVEEMYLEPIQISNA